MNKRVAAGIVLYNPDIERLRLSLESVYIQVKKVFLIDNNSKNLSQIETLLKEYPECELRRNSENRGIASALNQLMEMADREDYQWVLTLDDDSICDKDMVEKLENCTGYRNAGIICAEAIDEKMSDSRKGNCAGKTNGLYQEVRDCITAGSLTNVEIWKKMGGFDSRMFIDFVDVEYCTRLRENGYKIIQVPGTYVHQQYGNISDSFSIFGKKYYLFNYSPVRIYYSVRNQIYYMKKHRGNVSILNQILFLLGYIGKRIIFEKNRSKSIKAACKGIRDGIKMQV